VRLEVPVMKKALFAFVWLVFICSSVHSQTQMSKVMVRVILLDKDLNQKPVPHLSIVLTPDLAEPAGARQMKTDFSGIAELHMPPGKYRLSTPDGVDFQSHHYEGEMAVDAADASPLNIDLSNDNARITRSPLVEPARKTGDLTLMFQKYQNSVVTVWSEIGSGTGFIVDSAGLVMTNQHVIGPSQLVAVQFDAHRKVAAKILTVDAERDVAILYADLRAFSEATPAQIATPQPGRELAAPGEKVFAIGSPLGLKKIITSGIVSKVEDRAIISDVNINHGNSGGPLFNDLGEVIGITTFLVPGGNGPGVAGVVRIDQAAPALEQARTKMQDAGLPSARLLPVEPSEPYPLASLKELNSGGKFDKKPYVFTVGGFVSRWPPPFFNMKCSPSRDMRPR
jgi:S1-C subfamily serine protease